ncbi:MAG: type II toxin-antitoxin system VapC family toxin, partial [Burkholderiales bacterium]
MPLLFAEPEREALLDSLERDPEMLVWWGTPVECASAIARREREGVLDLAQASAALDRLRSLALAWHEVLPSDAVRNAAQRLLRVHPLRAADSLQLAGAVVAAEGEAPSLEFVCLDERLSAAAAREGFVLLG